MFMLLFGLRKLSEVLEEEVGGACVQGYADGEIAVGCRAGDKIP